MKDNKSLNKHFESIAWGALFLLIGGLKLIPGDQDDVFVLGVGIILLGLNLARALSGIPTGIVTLTLGITASLIGTVAVLRQPLGLPRLELPLFAVLMIVIGVIVLGRAARQAMKG